MFRTCAIHLLVLLASCSAEDSGPGEADLYAPSLTQAIGDFTNCMRLADWKAAGLCDGDADCASSFEAARDPVEVLKLLSGTVASDGSFGSLLCSPGAGERLLVFCEATQHRWIALGDTCTPDTL
jgi:hypothetical protein